MDKQSTQHGFTLIEIILSLAILTLLFSSILLIIPRLAISEKIHQHAASLRVQFNALSENTPGQGTLPSFSDFQESATTNVVPALQPINVAEAPQSLRCYNRLFTDKLIQNVQPTQQLTIANENAITDALILNGLLILSHNSAFLSDPDISVWSIQENSLHLLQQLNTGPGINTLALYENQLIAGNTSIREPLQLITISAAGNVELKSSAQLPVASIEQTQLPQKLLVVQNKLYVGTSKNTDAELFEFSFLPNQQLVFIQKLEIGSGINDLLWKDGALYAAVPLNTELLKIASSPTLSIIQTFDAPQGSGNGKTLTKLGKNILLGRTIGDQELFMLQNNILTPLSSVEGSVIAIIPDYRGFWLIQNKNPRVNFYEITAQQTHIQYQRIALPQFDTVNPLFLRCAEEKLFLIGAHSVWITL